MDLPVLGIHVLVASTPQGRQAGFTSGAPLVPSADEVITREALVDGEVKAVDADVQATVAPASASSPGATAFLQNWNDYKANWEKFRDAHQTTFSIVWPTGPGTGTVDRQVTAFENQLAGFRAALAQQFPNAKLTSQPITSTENAQIVPSPSTLPATNKWPTWAVVTATLAGVGLIGYLGYKAYETLSPTARLASAIAGSRGHRNVGPNDLYLHHLRGSHDARDPGGCSSCGAPVRYAGDYGPDYEGVAVE